MAIVPIDYPDPVAADWPDLLEIVERHVKPLASSRRTQSGGSYGGAILRRRDRLYTTIAPAGA